MPVLGDRSEQSVARTLRFGLSDDPLSPKRLLVGCTQKPGTPAGVPGPVVLMLVVQMAQSMYVGTPLPEVPTSTREAKAVCRRLAVIASAAAFAASS